MSHQPHGRRILVVDDNVDLAITTALFLRLCGHVTSTAFNARDAVAQARAMAPEILLLDLGLPDGDGYEVAHILRGELGPEAPRIIAISACDPALASPRWRSSLFDEYLVKPVSMDHLLQLIETPLPGRAGEPCEARAAIRPPSPQAGRGAASG